MEMTLMNPAVQMLHGYWTPMFTLKYQVTGTVTKRTAKEGGYENKA